MEDGRDRTVEDRVVSNAAWEYLGSDTITNDRRISLPKPIIQHWIDTDPEEMKLSDSEPEHLHWGFESYGGSVIISTAELDEQPRFKSIGARIPHPHRGYRIGIPSEFFSDISGSDLLDLATVPEKAQLHRGETLHFVTRSGSLTGEIGMMDEVCLVPKSCYTLTDDKLKELLQSRPEDIPAFQSVPK